jgi:hypothetical protein
MGKLDSTCVQPHPGSASFCRPPHVNRRPDVIIERSRATSGLIANTLRSIDRCVAVQVEPI